MGLTKQAAATNKGNKFYNRDCFSTVTKTIQHPEKTVRWCAEKPTVTVDMVGKKLTSPGRCLMSSLNADNVNYPVRLPFAARFWNNSYTDMTMSTAGVSANATSLAHVADWELQAVCLNSEGCVQQLPNRRLVRDSSGDENRIDALFPLWGAQGMSHPRAIPAFSICSE